MTFTCYYTCVWALNIAHYDRYFIKHWHASFLETLWAEIGIRDNYINFRNVCILELHDMDTSICHTKKPNDVHYPYTFSQLRTFLKCISLQNKQVIADLFFVLLSSLLLYSF